MMVEVARRAEDGGDSTVFAKGELQTSAWGDSGRDAQNFN